MPLFRGIAEILCDEQECPSYAPDKYRPKGTHTYPTACLYRSKRMALHVLSDGFHIVDTEQHELKFIPGFLPSLPEVAGTKVSWTSATGDALSLTEATPEDAARFARVLIEIAHGSRTQIAEEASLVANPGQYHGQVVQFTTTWTSGFEHSSAAGAWLTTDHVKIARNQSFTRAQSLVRISGLWLCQPGRQVYGHLGGYRAEVLAYAIDEGS